MTENYAAVLHGPYDLRIEKWPMPAIDDDEVLVEMQCVGICGSDLKLYSTGRCGREALRQPTVIGHEGAGIVLKTGSKVTGLAIGDRVAIEPTQPCGACAACKRGRYNLCELPNYCATADCHGNLCRYYKHKADFCHKIPDNLTLEEGAAVQPLAIALHACGRAQLRLGGRVAVLGAGPVGVLCALTARAMGATQLLITDVVESRLETAKAMGVEHGLLVTAEDSEQDLVERVVAALGAPPDVTIEACGVTSAQSVAMKATRAGGVVVVVGIGEERASLPLAAAMLREVDVRGSFRMANTYPAALAAVSRGAIDLKSFITHRFPLQKTKEALELAKKGAAMKIIIHTQQWNE